MHDHLPPIPPLNALISSDRPILPLRPGRISGSSLPPLGRGRANSERKREYAGSLYADSASRSSGLGEAGSVRICRLCEEERTCRAVLSGAGLDCLDGIWPATGIFDIRRAATGCVGIAIGRIRPRRRLISVSHLAESISSEQAYPARATTLTCVFSRHTASTSPARISNPLE